MARASRYRRRKGPLVYQLRDAERLVVVTRIARRDEATYRRL